MRLNLVVRAVWICEQPLGRNLTGRTEGLLGITLRLLQVYPVVALLSVPREARAFLARLCRFSTTYMSQDSKVCPCSLLASVGRGTTRHRPMAPWLGRHKKNKFSCAALNSAERPITYSR